LTTLGSLEAVTAWPVRTAAVAVVADDDVATVGPTEQVLPWASITKVLTAFATWLAVEEGTVRLDMPAGPDGSTIRHLLAHASGLGPDDRRVLAPPGTRRIYSNTGFEVLADAVASAAGMGFEAYVTEGILGPLAMRSTLVAGSPASGAIGSLADLLRLVHELRAPTLLAPGTVQLATTVTFAGLDGVLPGFGRQSPNDWGLGLEVRGRKSPHWMPPEASPRSFGHFGRAGGFVWIDPDRGVAMASLSDEPFGPWAAERWPALGTAVLRELGRA
jgi:CubicO group peptidase (beta-lactamase class C family)